MRENLHRTKKRAARKYGLAFSAATKTEIKKAKENLWSTGERSIGYQLI